MRKLLLLLLLTLAASPSFGQTSSTVKPLPLLLPAVKPLTLKVPEQLRLRDSLLTLRQVRVSLGKERRAWRKASGYYNRALDSLETAYDASQGEARRLKEAFVSSQVQLVSQTKKTAMYRARAHRKGVLNAVLSAAVAGLLYGIIIK